MEGGKEGNKKVALITGITGQDGSYLAELLISKNYQVHGIIRRASTFNTGRITHLYDDPKTHKQGKLILHYGDMTDTTCLVRIIENTKPDEIYNLAAQSHVKVSFELSEYTAEVDALGTLRLLDAIRICRLEKSVKFYQASTSELYGKVQGTPQNESTPFYPRSPYACSKLFGYWIVINYREAYNMFASNGILFNHESPRRGENFVTRKITRSVAKIHLGLLDVLELGNLDSKRDWGHAKDYVEAMWLMLQQDKPGDYVVATGETHSVREFVEASFQHVGIRIVWEGEGVNEVGKDADTGTVRVRVNPEYFRPTEVDFLLGDASKAKKELGWSQKISFGQVCVPQSRELKLLLTLGLGLTHTSLYDWGEIGYVIVLFPVETWMRNDSQEVLACERFPVNGEDEECSEFLKVHEFCSALRLQQPYKK